MARGWDSKSVEEQIASADSRRNVEAEPRLTPEQLSKKREVESLQLSRTRVLHDLEVATHPQHRASLQSALRFLDEKISTLQNG